MDDRVTSFFMLVPGPWNETQELCRALAERGFSNTPSETAAALPGTFGVEVVQDDHLTNGFTWGRQGPLAKEVLARVAICRSAAVVEFRGCLHEHASEVARLGRALRDAGGVAVRMEASGAASSWELWLDRLESGDLFRLYESAVLLVEDDGDTVFTCGMHQFDLPDAEVKMRDSRAAIAWLDAFCLYQLAEQPTLMSGHTFRPDADAERRSFERWPDHRHQTDDGRHNPFGVWRFLEPGARGIEPTQLALTMIPSLAAVLMAAESSAGRPLKRAEVEQIVANSATVALEPRDARALERSRGYADIEPELAWEQWQIVRTET